MKKTRILLVDDHSVVRMGLAAIINLEKDLAVVGEAENGEEAARLAQTLKPDVVVMDLMMPGMSGAEATAAVKGVAPDAKVLILTSFGTSAELADALASGATGAVTKSRWRLTRQDLRPRSRRGRWKCLTPSHADFQTTTSQ